MSQKVGLQVDLLRCHLKLHIFKGQYSRSEVKLGHQNTNNTRELVFRTLASEESGPTTTSFMLCFIRVGLARSGVLRHNLNNNV